MPSAYSTNTSVESEGLILNSLIMLAQGGQPDGAGGLLAGGACMIFALILGLAGLALWIWALVDAIKNPALDSNERLIWILVIVFASWIGAIIYLAIGRKK